MRNFEKHYIFALACWSGFFVMSIELLSGRILAPYFGGGIYVWGAIITVFMLALSAGYLAGGRISVASPSLRKLGGMLIGMAVTTLPVVLLGDLLLDWLQGVIEDPRYGSLTATCLLFFLPTAICGSVSPYAIRLLFREACYTGKSAGELYFVSTFGSALGTLSTSFYLVLYFEINQIIYAMAAITVALGVLSILVKSPRHESH